MKRFLALVLTGVLLFSLGGCGKDEFDAKAYVQAIMDAKFHREYADYAKIIGLKEEEAKEQMESEFNQSIEDSMADFKEKYGITEEEMAQYIQMEADIRAKVQYTVKDAVKDEEGNYTVDVQVTPIFAYDNLDATFNEKLIAAVQNGATEEQYMSILLTSFQECIDNAETGETVTFTFHVTAEETENQILYGVSEKEMINMDLIALGQPTE